jgi:hypothetical protein
MMLLKKILWYNMFDLEMKGKDIKLAKKGTSMILVATVLICIIDYFLWNLEFFSDIFSDEAYDSVFSFGYRFLGKLLGLLSFCLFYLFVFMMMGRKHFFEQTLQEYQAMSLIEKDSMAKEGKYISVIPFALALLILMYLIFFRLD